MTEQVAETPQKPIEQPAQDTTPVQAQPDPLATLLSEIKDESGRQKYTDVETALKALKSSQEYIPQLKTELSSLKERAELQNDFKTVQELLMTTDESQTSAMPDLGAQAVTPAVEQPTPATEPSLEDQFKEFLAKQKAEETAESNLSKVHSKLSEVYGEKMQEVYESKAQELGINAEFLNQMAQKSPQAVLEYFKRAPVAATPTGTVNVQSIPKPAADVKPVMFGASSADVRAAWDACKS